MTNQQTAVLLRTVLRLGRGRLRGVGGVGEVCLSIISERARSSARCRDCPHWLRSLSSGGAPRCQRTLTAATSPFSRSPVLSPEPLPPAGRPSLFSTSSSCSGTTPSPKGGEVDRKTRRQTERERESKQAQNRSKAFDLQGKRRRSDAALPLKVWQRQLHVDELFHLPLAIYLFFTDSAAAAVFTSLRLMIKLLLKTVYTSRRRASLSVDTCALGLGGGGNSLLSRQSGGFIFGECHSEGTVGSRGQEVS